MGNYSSKMVSSSRLLKRLQDTIVLRASLRGGKVDKALLRGVDPQPSTVFGMLVSTKACTDAEIIEFIKGLKDLQDDSTGEPIVTVNSLEYLANELWKVQVQDEASPAVGAKPASEPTDDAPAACNESAQEAGVCNDQQAMADASDVQHRQDVSRQDVSRAAPSNDVLATEERKNVNGSITCDPGSTGGNAATEQGLAAPTDAKPAGDKPAAATAEQLPAATPVAVNPAAIPTKGKPAVTRAWGQPAAAHACVKPAATPKGGQGRGQSSAASAGANPAAAAEQKHAQVVPARVQPAAAPNGGQPAVQPAGESPAATHGGGKAGVKPTGRQPAENPAGRKPPVPSSPTPAGPGRATVQKRSRELCNEEAKAGATQAAQVAKVRRSVGGSGAGADVQARKSKEPRTYPPHPNWAPPTITAWVDRILDAVPVDGSPTTLSELGTVVPRPTNVPKNRTLHKILKAYPTWFMVDGNRVTRKQTAMAAAPAKETKTPVAVIELDD